MPQRLEKLRATIHELEAELQSVDTLDVETRAALEEAIEEIQATLHRREAAIVEPSYADRSDAEPEHESLIERLKASTREFEADHPTLAGVINRTIDALAQLGI